MIPRTLGGQFDDQWSLVSIEPDPVVDRVIIRRPIVNQAGMREAIRKFGPDNQTDVIFENLADSRSIQLTQISLKCPRCVQGCNK